jgi:hypothetical protein
VGASFSRVTGAYPPSDNAAKKTGFPVQEKAPPFAAGRVDGQVFMLPASVMDWRPPNPRCSGLVPACIGLVRVDAAPRAALGVSKALTVTQRRPWIRLMGRYTPTRKGPGASSNTEAPRVHGAKGGEFP